jgi:hypothetical protein
MYDCCKFAVFVKQFHILKELIDVSIKTTFSMKGSLKCENPTFGEVLD